MYVSSTRIRLQNVITVILLRPVKSLFEGGHRYVAVSPESA